MQLNGLCPSQSRQRVISMLLEGGYSGGLYYSLFSLGILTSECFLLILALKLGGSKTQVDLFLTLCSCYPLVHSLHL